MEVSDIELLEKYWPPLANKFNIFHLFSRDQLNKPIIAVYKKAAKMVKNHVYLANILCCTIDALCLSTDGNVYLPSLEKSLVNITAHLRKLEVSVSV